MEEVFECICSNQSWVIGNGWIECDICKRRYHMDTQHPGAFNDGQIRLGLLIKDIEKDGFVDESPI